MSGSEQSKRTEITAEIAEKIREEISQRELDPTFWILPGINAAFSAPLHLNYHCAYALS